MPAAVCQRVPWLKCRLLCLAGETISQLAAVALTMGLASHRSHETSFCKRLLVITLAVFQLCPRHRLWLLRASVMHVARSEITPQPAGPRKQ